MRSIIDGRSVIGSRSTGYGHAQRVLGASVEPALSARPTLNPTP